MDVSKIEKCSCVNIEARRDKNTCQYQMNQIETLSENTFSV